MASSNVLELPIVKKVAPRNSAAMRKALPEQRTEVLQLDGALRDDALLKRFAPWLEREINVIDEWRHCLLMSRFAKHVDAALGASTVGNIRWELRWKTDIRGKISTPAGNVLISMSDHGAHFEGHRDALLHAGLARENWLRTGPRGGPASQFEAHIFEAKRKLKIHRCRDRYSLFVGSTDEECEQVTPERFEALAKAKERARTEVNKLPSSRSDFQCRFTALASLAADLLEHHTLMDEGGFSLDDGSRAAILTQLYGLRQTIQMATACFDRDERVSHIKSIAQQHAPDR
ncbi:hypothetical protein [Burkholderia arboris]|uniref:hypothetical protein n=1 Tax=Burkholderia arboris TaxID=488730 RepID=UPI002109AF1B|nr:hypothetical protein [Burkholderia arboris]UTV55194.1 hypothetical protein NLX30_02130 [Burkholderia arboris]